MTLIIIITVIFASLILVGAIIANKRKSKSRIETARIRCASRNLPIALTENHNDTTDSIIVTESDQHLELFKDMFEAAYNNNDVIECWADTEPMEI